MISSIFLIYLIVNLVIISLNASLFRIVSQETNDFSVSDITAPLPPGSKREDDIPNDDNVFHPPGFFSAGYYIQSTYSNAPFSCEGSIVAAAVTKFNISICYVDTTISTSYRMLLDVSNCESYFKMNYNDMACSVPGTNETISLGSRTCASGVQSSCHFNYNPNVNLVSSYPLLSSVTYNPTGQNCLPPQGGKVSGNIIGYDQIVANLCFYKYGVYQTEVYRYVKAVQTSSSTYGLTFYKSLVNCQYNSNAVDNSPSGALGVCITNNKKNPQNQYLVNFVQSSPYASCSTNSRRLIENEVTELALSINKKLEATTDVPSVSPTTMMPTNPTFSPATGYQTSVQSNGITYTSGYYMTRIYSNAPDSCEGNVVQEVVQKFGYHVCYLDQLNPTTSYYQLLDVVNCWRYLKVTYDGLDCSGAVLTEASYNLTITGQSPICHRGASGTCSFLFPETNIPSTSSIISTSNYPQLTATTLEEPVCTGTNASVYWRTTNNLCVYTVQTSQVTVPIASGPWMKTYLTYPSGYFIGLYSSKLNCMTSSDTQYTRKGVMNTCLTYSTNAPITQSITNYFIASFNGGVPCGGSNNNDDSKLTDGAIAGIVIGVFVFVIIAACIALLCFQFCSRKPSAAASEKKTAAAGGVSDSTALI